jgi:cytochrome c oxidase cbb3-type subunit III
MYSRCRIEYFYARGVCLTLALLLFTVLGGCQREDRAPHPVTPQQPAVKDLALTDLYAGSPNPPPPDSHRQEYENNAFHLSQGQKWYQWFNCTGCHANGGGDSGPPHIDDQWRYGSSLEQIYASIVEGRPNGMPSYRGKMSEQQLWELAAYVKSMSGNVRRDAAPSRLDHMSTQEPPSAIDKAPPVNATDTGSVQGNSP